MPRVLMAESQYSLLSILLLVFGSMRCHHIRTRPVVGDAKPLQQRIQEQIKANPENTFSYLSEAQQVIAKYYLGFYGFVSWPERPGGREMYALLKPEEVGAVARSLVRRRMSVGEWEADRYRRDNEEVRLWKDKNRQLDLHQRMNKVNELYKKCGVPERLWEKVPPPGTYSLQIVKPERTQSLELRQNKREAPVYSARDNTI